MKKILLNSLCMAMALMASSATFAQDSQEAVTTTTDVVTPTADTYLRKGNKDNNGSKTTMEICTYDGGNNAAKAKDFVGVMSFELPAEATDDSHEIQSVSLRLVAERVKGGRGLSLYAYPEFVENAIYANEEEKIAAARTESNLIKKINVKGASTAMAIDKLADEYKTVDAWTNTIDLTEYVKTLDKNSFAIMMVKDNSNEPIKFYTKEQKDDAVNAKDATIVFAAKDLAPQLTVVYNQKTATGIEKVAVTVPASAHNGKVYNLHGIQMDEQNLSTGIYIKNGKKFIVK